MYVLSDHGPVECHSRDPSQAEDVLTRSGEHQAAPGVLSQVVKEGVQLQAAGVISVALEHSSPPSQMLPLTEARRELVCLPLPPKEDVAVSCWRGC